MDMLDEEWVNELREQRKGHILLAALDSSFVQLLPKYNKLVASLPREQQELLKEFAYIQQRRQVWLTQQAYLTGVEVGKRYPR